MGRGEGSGGELCVCVYLNTRQEGLGMRQERLETRLEFIASLSSFSLTTFVTHSH